MSISVRAAAAVIGSQLLAVTLACAAELEVKVHDLEGRPLMDAVVYVEPKAGVGATSVPSRTVAHASIDQVNKEFVPLVSVLRTNTEVNFPNSDNIRHSIYSFSAPKPFKTKLYSGKQAPPVLFDKPGLVLLGCNIHDTMMAWVVVVDTPYFAKTGANGAAVLTGLEPGDYRVNVWYPRPDFQPAASEVHVGSEPTGHLEVKVDSSGSPLPELRARAEAPKR